MITSSNFTKLGKLSAGTCVVFNFSTDQLTDAEGCLRNLRTVKYLSPGWFQVSPDVSKLNAGSQSVTLTLSVSTVEQSQLASFLRTFLMDAGVIFVRFVEPAT